MTIKELLDQAASLARSLGSDATTWDARLLLAHTLGGRNPLGLDLKAPLEDEKRQRFETLWARRLAGVPVQHLIGEWDFYGRPFRVDSRALVPRPETEILVTEALAEAPEARRILDAGTGSGIIAVTWLLERPEADAVALDISVDALTLARENALRHAVIGRLRLLASDWLTAVRPVAFDALLSNPPYLALGESPHLPPTVRDHDPRRALFAGEDGLLAIRHLLDTAPPFVAAGGLLAFEIGFGQAGAVEAELRRRPDWVLRRIVPDLEGIPRVALARRAGTAAAA
ncbi:MAG TPA: peptide chain release factor N(5)-glutamine methyltransferase [Thermoanaerobaculia bacterium]|jgi:release factor glutamine methyltransferase